MTTSTAAPSICSLNDLGDSPAGGKAEGLARLISMGLSVPPGFVVLHASPNRLPDDLQNHYEALGNPVVAVRSSAIGEDSAGASFAGQYETMLNVQGIDQLRSAINQCLASVGNDRAKAYKDEKTGFDQVQMAVVVQQQVEARCAGVLFTVDPVTNRRDHIII
ncbi:MAG: hypothetical protein KDI30_09185, partial [Pseudomonadales bacterium]|nr:hypothetical protein [Pseudomonadales bacterium]